MVMGLAAPPRLVAVADRVPLRGKLESLALAGGIQLAVCKGKHQVSRFLKGGVTGGQLAELGGFVWVRMYLLRTFATIIEAGGWNGQVRPDAVSGSSQLSAISV